MLDFPAMTPHELTHTTNPTKITLVHTGRIIEVKGGAEKVFCEMANALTKMGYSVTALCADPRDGLPGFPINKEVIFKNATNHIPFFNRKIFQKIKAIHLDQNKRKAYRKMERIKWKKGFLKKCINESNPDIVISFDIDTTWLIRNIFGKSLPIITMLHSYPRLFIDDPFFDIFKDCLGHNDIIQVLMPEYISTFKELLPKQQIIYIPNAVPQSLILPNNEARTIVCMARIVQDKRPDLLIRAFSRISMKFPSWKLEFYGNTELRPNYTQELNNLIKELHLQDNVFLRGATSDVFSKLKEASIFVFPSSFEGFPLALTEAMSIGLPCIGCEDCSSVNSLIKHNHNGILSKPNPDRLAEAIENLVLSKETRARLGLQAKEDMKQFSPYSVWSMWQKAIDRFARTDHQH